MLHGNIKETWGERLREMWRFLLVGASCFFLEFFLLYVLTENGIFDYFISAAVAFIVSLVVNYILCVTFVFHAQKQSTEKTTLFVLTSLMGLGINQLTIWGFVELVGMWYMAAKVIASGVVMIWNYVTKRYILRSM